MAKVSHDDLQSQMLLRKLRQVMVLTDTERQAIADLPGRVVRFAAREDIVSEGGEPTDVHLIHSGIGCRFTLLQDGPRQITSFLVPGDFCDLRALLMGPMDHTVSTLSL